MSNIEDDVKILEEFAEICKAGLACYDQTREGKALEHILAEREQMIAEKKKYTIRLTDEQYRKVIENAQMDTSNDTVVAHRFAVMQQQINEKDKRIQELEEELAKYKDIDYMFKIDSNENRVDMKKIYFEWLEYKNKIQKLEEESEILEFQNKQVENYAEELKKYNKTVSDRMVEYKKNSIPKQAVINKIEEIKKDKDSKYYDKFLCERDIENVIEILQELLEGEK